MSARQGSHGFVGLLPAAGRGARLASLRYPKELLPIIYGPGRDGAEARPRAIAEYALDAMHAAGVERCVLVVAPWKLDIVTYFGDGSHLGMDIAYVVQEEAWGLPYAIDLAFPWIREADVIFAMPDTLFWPKGTISQLRELYVRTRADLALAVFPTDEPERLGPVVYEGRRVLAVVDKPEIAPARNTWGAAIWGPRFSDLLHRELPPAGEELSEPVLGHFFDLAVRSGLVVRVHAAVDGGFQDAGTGVGIAKCLELMRASESEVAQ